MGIECKVTATFMFIKNLKVKSEDDDMTLDTARAVNFLKKLAEEDLLDEHTLRCASIKLGIPLVEERGLPAVEKSVIELVIDNRNFWLDGDDDDNGLSKLDASDWSDLALHYHCIVEIERSINYEMTERTIYGIDGKALLEESMQILDEVAESNEYGKKSLDDVVIGEYFPDIAIMKTLNGKA